MSRLMEQIMSTVPLAFSTALYALEDRAHLQSGQVGSSMTFARKLETEELSSLS